MSHTPDDIVLLATKSRVLAVSRADGQTIWERELPGSWGGGFVSLVADGESVFAHTNGRLHCLDLDSGELLWTHELPGCGYGFASLALPGGPSTDLATIQALRASREASGAS